MRYRAVIISPHLDDAVFSCGHRITRLVHEGPVLVLNVFTRFLNATKDYSIVLDDSRHDEESASKESLGYVSVSFGELDCYFRREEYHSIGNIFKPPIAEDCGEYLVTLRKRIFTYLKNIEYDELYLPLAIGWQVDHLLTYRLFEPWIGQENLIFYEDAPYCLMPHMTRLRLDEIGIYECDSNDQSLVAAQPGNASLSVVRSLFDTALMRNLRPKGLRWLALPVVSWYLYRLIALHQKQKKYHKLTSMIISVKDFSKKIESMMLYKSQFQEFFLDCTDCRKIYASYANKVGASSKFIERYWKIQAI